MSILSMPVSGIAGHRAMAVIEARRMARQPVFVFGVVLAFAVLGLYLVLVGDETGVAVALTLPLLGAFYIGLTSVIAAARLTRSTEVAVEAVATAPAPRPSGPSPSPRPASLRSWPGWCSRVPSPSP
jgi:hypothetical protein